MAGYSLATHLVGQGFLDAFDFFNASDPSRGFVNYQSYENAVDMKLVTVEDDNKVRLGVDSDNTYNVNTDIGRPSVRLTSKDSYSNGLFIADFSRVPTSACGSWPAFWALNNEAPWPAGGEIDIYEGQNDIEKNLFTAHTGQGCMLGSEGYTGTADRTDCGPDEFNRGCNISPQDSLTYGDALNSGGGGVYAMEWTDDGIKIWSWVRGNVPDDIKLAPLQTPDPSTWGPPQALFGGPSGSSCETGKYFYNMSLAINIDFCGDYADTFWDQSSCSMDNAPQTCREFVAGNPGAFEKLYWEINYIDVWSKADSTTKSNSTTPTFANTTTTPFTRVTLSADPNAEPTGANGGFIDEATLDGYTLLGCFGSSDGYPTFEPIAQLPDMDNEACVSLCSSANKKFAGTAVDTCYCADTLGDASATDNGRCNIECLGCYYETCGGYANGMIPAPNNNTGSFNSSDSFSTTGMPADSTASAVVRRGRFHRRAAPADLLLTLYGNLAGDVAPAPPGIGGDSGTGPISTPPATAAITTAVTVTFTTVCATNPAELVVLEYCTTLTIEECASATAPQLAGVTPDNAVAAAISTAVPMTTLTETCEGCGANGQSTVTLTIPEIVATGGSAIVVTAVTVATVVPQVNGSFAAAYNGSSPSPSQLPVPGGADNVAVVAWGVVLWLGIFSVMLVL